VQVPVPLQLPAGVWVVPVHDSEAPQAVPLAYCLQAPAPLQAPVAPHELGACMVQVPSFTPSDTGWHWPEGWPVSAPLQE
jgi:hypothetical protein